MKQKKLLAGAIATALVLSTGVAAYAAEPHISNLLASQVKGEISTARKGILSFDETALPEGVQFAQKVSPVGGEDDNLVQSWTIDDEAILSFDETSLPEGVQFAQKVSPVGSEDDNLVQSWTIDDEAILSFDETALPEGVQFAIKGSNTVANGVMNLE